jgi:hypothetical protein
VLGITPDPTSPMPPSREHNDVTLVSTNSSSCWTRALTDFITNPTLTEDERVTLLSCSADKIAGDFQDWEAQNREENRFQQCMKRLGPLISGLERYGGAIDVFCNAEPFGILALCWGSVRIVLQVRNLFVGSMVCDAIKAYFPQAAKDYNTYFENICNLLGRIGETFGRLMEYEAIMLQPSRFEESLFRVFQEYLNFARRLHKLFFRVKKSGQ